MTQEELARHPATRMLRDVLIDLSLMSHVGSATYDSSVSGKPTGGNRPPGGIDRQGDREEDYRQKTAPYFARRFDRLSVRAADGRASDGDLASLLVDARQALQDWRKAPKTTHPRPEDLTEYDKSQIAADVRSTRVVGSEWGVSHVTVLRYRRRYGNPVRSRRELSLRAGDADV